MKNLMTICLVVLFVLAVSGTAKAELIAHWQFEEPSGLTASDSSGNNNDGTLTNMVGDEWVGGALEFDGDDDHVKVLSPPFPDIDSQITIAMWVNADIVEDGKILLWKSGNYGLAVGYTNVGGDPGTFGFTIRGGDTWSGGAWRTVSSTNTPVAGEWYHIAGTFDGIALRIYLNGVLESTLPYSGSFYSDPWPDFPDVYVGGHPWPGEDLTFEGLIDDARIYNHALSADEIAALANPACVPAPSDMIGWWPGDGNADDIADIVSGNDGTLMNGATYAAGKVEQAFSFDGVDDYVSVPSDPIFDLTSQGSWTAWVKLDRHVESLVQHIVTVNQGGVPNARQWALEISMTNKLQMAIRKSDNSTWVSVTDSQDFPLNQWVFVAATYDNTSIPSLNIYRNGNLVASNNDYHGDINTGTGSELRISSDVWQFNGLIDEVEIYNRALSDVEIQDIFDAGSAGKCKAIEVVIDIKPGSNEEDSANENTIPLGSLGLIPVAIFSVCDEEGGLIFDATTIDPDTVKLAGADVDVRMQGKGLMTQNCDVDGDGCIDLIVHMATANLDEGALQEGYAVLTGETYDGQAIIGWDYVTVVPVE